MRRERRRSAREATFGAHEATGGGARHEWGQQEAVPVPVGGTRTLFNTRRSDRGRRPGAEKPDRSRRPASVGLAGEDAAPSGRRVRLNSRLMSLCTPYLASVNTAKQRGGQCRRRLVTKSKHIMRTSQPAGQTAETTRMIRHRAETLRWRDERPPRRETGDKRNRKQQDGETENNKMRDERQARQEMMSEA